MTITALSDAELLEQARSGDEAAFTELYVRHQPAALRLARTYRRLGDPDELVNGSFERVLGAIKRGAGPTDSFRAYLFVTLRRYAAEKAAKPDEESLDEVPEPITDAADSPALAQADRALITEAFESLPERWQAVLWHTAVEGRPPRELADVMGVSANAAAAMSYRAREKLRQAYLQAHLLASPAPDHEPYRSELGAYVRGGLSARDTAAVEKHLEGCESCRALVAELEDVNRTLARAVLPLFLLVGGGKLGGALIGGAAAGAAADKGSGAGLAGKIRHLAPTVGSTAAIAAVVAGMVGMGSVVARQDTGPINSAADAADLGIGGDGGGGGNDRSSSDDDGDSIFGDDDFAVSPFDDDGFDDLGDFDDRFGFGDDFDDFGDDFDFPAASRRPVSRIRSTGGSPSSPTPPPGPNPTNPSDPGPGPGPDPGPGPGPGPGPSTPTPLQFSSATWTPTAVGSGTLAVDIGEQGTAVSPAALVQPTALVTPAAFEAPGPVALETQATGEPLRAELTLSAGARIQPGGALDPRCTAAAGGQTVTCTLDQPPAGGGTTFSFPIQIDGPGQTADMVLFRGAAEEARFSVPVGLETFENGLTLGSPTWTQIDAGERPIPVGRLDVDVTAGARALTGVTVTVDIDQDAAFAPDELFGQIPPGLLEKVELPAEIRTAIAELQATRLPAGCTLTGWTSSGAGEAWVALLFGRLPTQVVCTFDLQPGATASLDGITAVIDPLYGDRDWKAEGTATVTLAVQGRQVAQSAVPLSSTLTPPAPR